MKIMTPFFRTGAFHIFAAVAAFVLASAMLAAQTPTARIQSEIDSSRLSPIPGSQSALARVAPISGRMPSHTAINGITLRFNRSAQQEAALDALIQAQQNPSSPLYHQWLTPDQFAARFGVSQPDIDKVESWLQQQGFTIDAVNRSHTAIRFSGNAGQVESAFATQMHFYQFNGAKALRPVHRALGARRPSPALSPTSITSPTSAPILITSFPAKRFHLRLRRGNVFFAPRDIVTTYDIKPLYSAGVNGAGQTIAIVGQSSIPISAISRPSRPLRGSAKRIPTWCWCRARATPPPASGDESESDLDLEWSGAIAPGATIDFVYVGSSPNYGTFDAADYAIDEGIGNIISMSYSACELDPYVDLRLHFQPGGNLQAGSVPGPNGSRCLWATRARPACYGDTNLNVSGNDSQESLAVNYPASSAYVTAVGGTEIASEFSSGGSSISQYWNAPTAAPAPRPAQLSQVLHPRGGLERRCPAQARSSGALLQRLPVPCLSLHRRRRQHLSPSQAWQSTYFTATGETNPSSSHRLVPDISFYASPEQPGYLYCTSDQSAWGQSQTGSCN